MAIAEWKKEGTVAILTMTKGENRHNPEWCEVMLSIYNEILDDSQIKAIVLTSGDPKNFCLGVDTDWLLKRLGENDYPAISRWLYINSEVFKAMLMSPVPTIAAINGHAFGNGAMLAGACDFRFMRADRGYLCLPEIDLGIQLAPSMLEWMKRIMPYHLFIRMLLSGERIGAAELEKHNVITKACENAEKTLEEAVAFAGTFNKSRTGMAEMKQRAYKHIIDKMKNDDPQYFDYIPEAAKEGRSPVFMLTPLT
ncbi:MAG: enoyl-CoA hydratase/isomerase family protein [Syntrophomonadaceae bacterium]|jgi:enoyl-CoA hydratase/carnithine racemase|nr:enoyl-CoA hydratase/isomerase family protein [Syntrophomonadaceae bacterium]